MPSIAEAQRKIKYSDLGESKGAFDSVQLSTVEAMLELYALEFIQRAQDNLNKTNSVSSGALSDSLKFNVQSFGRSYTLQIKAADYYDYVNQGVRGVQNIKGGNSPYKFKTINPSGAHVTAIGTWLKTGKAKIQARDVKKYGKVGVEKKGIEAQRKSLAYVIARSIKKKGLKPTHFFSDAFTETFQDFGLQMSKALGEDIKVDLRQMAKQVKRK